MAERIPLGLDLDSTLADFPQAAIMHLREQGYDVTLADWTTKRLDQCFGKEVDDCVRAAMKTEEFWWSMEPMPGAIRELVRLIPDFELHIITHRGQWITNLTREWCCLNEIPFDTIDLVEGWPDKLPLLQEYKCLGHIDDDPDVCKMTHDAGFVTGQFIWPWNYTYEDMIRASKWSGLAYAMELKLKDKQKSIRGYQ